MKIRKCIIPIAGRGTRFLPITKAVSKEMLPILNKPSIYYQVKECIDSGIEEIIFVVGHHNESLVKKFFSKDHDLDEFLDNDYKKEMIKEIDDILSKVDIKYAVQDERYRGSAGSVYAAKEYIDKDEYFAVMFGDDLVMYDNPPLKELIEYHNICNTNVLGIGDIPDNLITKYGLIKYKKDNIVDSFVNVSNIEDAPSKESLLGRLIVHSTVFDKILSGEKVKNKEYGLPRILLSLDEDLRTYKFSGNYYDIGSVEGFIKANIMFGIKNKIISKETIKSLLEKEV